MGLLTTVCRYIEVAAEAVQRAWVLRVAYLVALSHQENLVLVALVVACGTTADNAEWRVLAYEGHLFVVAHDGCRRSAADGDALEYGVHDVVACGRPLNNIRCTSLNSCYGAEVQRQHAIGVKVRCHSHFLDGGSCQWAGSYLCGSHRERQTERVPVAVFGQRATAECDVGLLAVEAGGECGHVVSGSVLQHVNAHERLTVQLAHIGDGSAKHFAAVIEALAVGYCYGAVVAAGGDVVAGVAPAEGDVVVGVDAEAAAAAGGVDGAAVDGDVFAGDAPTILVLGGGGDGAAVDDEVAAAPDAVAVVAGGVDGAAVDDEAIGADAVVAGSVDDAAVDGEGACIIVGSIYTTGSVEGAGLSVLAVEVEVAKRTPEGMAAVAIDGHGLAVAEDDVDVAIASNLSRVAEVDADEVPLLLPVVAEAGLRAVEGDGLDGVVTVVQGAVGIDVGDGDGLAGAGEVVGADGDGDVGVRHSERRAVEGASAGRVAVLVAFGCAGGGVAEGEAELVVAAVVEGLAALQASAAVGGDAADGVLGRCAGEGDGLDGDVGGGGDGAGGVAVVILVGMVCVCGVVGGVVGAVAEVVGVVAVVGIYLVAGEGGAGRVQDGDLGGGEEAVADFCPAFAPAEEAADGVGRCAEQTAVEQAAGDGERAGLLYADDAAVGAVAADGALDGDADAAVLDADGAPAAADETAGELLVGSDGARDVQVAEGGGAFSLVAGVGLGVADVAEGGDVLRGSVGDVVAADVDGQRVALSVEGAAEVVVRAAGHAADGDVVAEADGLAAEAVVGVVVIEGGAHDAPSGGGADGVGVAADGEVVAGGEADVGDGGAGLGVAYGAGDAVVDVVAVADGAFTGGIAYDGADIAIACDGAAEVDAVLDGAAAMACDAAVIFATDGGGDAGGAGAAGDGAEIVAYDAAVVVGIGCNGVDGDVAEDVAVLYATVVVDAYDGAAVVVAGEAGVGEEYVLHLGTIAELSEESRISFLGFTAALVDADTADGVALAVEVAFEVSVIVVVVAADGREVVLGAAGVVPVGGVAVSEVGGQHEVIALVLCAAVHVGSQLVQVAGTGNQVRVGTGAATTPCPRRLRSCEGENEGEQQHGCP